MNINMVYGPPGTGKTHELLHLLEMELSLIPPTQIAFVSFTKEGADQGKTRALKAFPKYKEEDFIYFRTLHSLAFKMCHLNRESVMGKYNYAEFSKKMGMSFTGYYTEDFKSNDDMYLFYDEVYRNTPSVANTYLELLDVDKLKFVRKSYAAYKKQFGMYDYTDMVSMFIAQDMTVPVKVAFIDEAQDLTRLQWQMVWLAFRNCDRIYIAGDDDQAIYQWSGADVDYFLSLEGASTILRYSHRVPDSIKNFASTITDQISHRVKKDYSGTGEQGEIFYINSLEEVEIKDNETYMFLSRNNFFLTAAIDMMRRRGLVYDYKGTPSIKPMDVKAIGIYEKARRKETITRDEMTSLSPYLKRGYSMEDPWYDSMKFDQDYCTYLRQVIKNKPKTIVPRIRISTIHAVKGGEADNVILMTDMTKSTYENLQRNPDAEHRVFYVGATRAKKTLTLMYPTAKYSYPILSMRGA